MTVHMLVALHVKVCKAPCATCCLHAGRQHAWRGARRCGSRLRSFPARRSGFQEGSPTGCNSWTRWGRAGISDCIHSLCYTCLIRSLWGTTTAARSGDTLCLAANSRSATGNSTSNSSVRVECSKLSQAGHHRTRPGMTTNRATCAARSCSSDVAAVDSSDTWVTCFLTLWHCLLLHHRG